MGTANGGKAMLSWASARVWVGAGEGRWLGGWGLGAVGGGRGRGGFLGGDAEVESRFHQELAALLKELNVRVSAVG